LVIVPFGLLEPSFYAVHLSAAWFVAQCSVWNELCDSLGRRVRRRGRGREYGVGLREGRQAGTGPGGSGLLVSLGPLIGGWGCRGGPH